MLPCLQDPDFLRLDDDVRLAYPSMAKKANPSLRLEHGCEMSLLRHEEPFPTEDSCNAAEQAKKDADWGACISRKNADGCFSKSPPQSEREEAFLKIACRAWG